MGLKAYKVSGKLMGLVSRALGIRIRVTGTENLVCRPTLFAPNHFTRVETFLVPYIIYKYAGRQVRSLGTHSVFKGIFGRYFEAVGGMSTRHPRRNRTIVRELMTCRSDWVIYPEGGLIKNKKTIHRGRYQLDQPDRRGPPHTGAAMLALKAEIAIAATPSLQYKQNSSSAKPCPAAPNGDRTRLRNQEAVSQGPRADTGEGDP